MYFAAGWNGFSGPILARGPYCSEPWHRLWRGVMRAHTIVGVQHQHWTVVIKLRRHGHNLLSRNTVTWRPARGTRQHRIPVTSPKAFHEEPNHILSRGRPSMCIRLWHAPRISQICWRVRLRSIVLRPRRKPPWILSSFGLTIFATSWHTLFLGDCAKRCRGSYSFTPVSLFVCGDDQFTIKLFAVSIKLGFSSGIREHIDAQFYGSFHLCKVKTSRLKNFAQFCQVRCQSRQNKAPRWNFLFSWVAVEQRTLHHFYFLTAASVRPKSPKSHSLFSLLPLSTTTLFCMRAACAELLSSL